MYGANSYNKGGSGMYFFAPLKEPCRRALQVLELERFNTISSASTMS